MKSIIQYSIIAKNLWFNTHRRVEVEDLNRKGLLFVSYTLLVSLLSNQCFFMPLVQMWLPIKTLREFVLGLLKNQWRHQGFLPWKIDVHLPQTIRYFHGFLMVVYAW